MALDGNIAATDVCGLVVPFSSVFRRALHLLCSMSRGPLGDHMVTLEDGRVLPEKKTICIPHGNLVTPAGPRVKLTAALREAAEQDEELLRLAAQNGAPINMRELIDKGVNVNSRCYANAATALICGAVKGNFECCKMLLDAGANPHYANVGCDTALTAAVTWGHHDIVKLLLDAGVDPRQANDAPVPMTPLDICKQYERDDISDLLTKYWLKLDQRDSKVKAKQDAAEKRAANAHRAKVSREAEERRQAQATGTAAA